ncbi:MAG TPA: hypothetical protein VN704_05390, partial [Verrucomicrobiae bacterium]|nr:hypothetical protein [Verrucomicrobiae bacterium]
IIIILSNYNGYQNTLAQKSNTTSVGTFSAKGYTGQTFVLPTGVMFTPMPNSISQFNLLPAAGSIIAGNWSFVINGGKLQDFQWDVQHLTLNGKINGTFSITKVSNSTGEVPPISTNKDIQLSNNNSTMFKANAQINFNGKTVFKDVPIVLSLLNGKLINLSIDSVKTEGLFTVPLFGIITSLTQ